MLSKCLPRWNPEECSVSRVTSNQSRSMRGYSNFSGLCILPVHGSRENTRETIAKKLNHSGASGS